MSKNCFFTEDGRLTQFTCGLSQRCCQNECCSIEFKFYTHWYFWVAVVVLVIFLVAAIISGYCRLRRQPPPYRALNTVTGLGAANVLPWVWGLDEESATSHSQSPDYQPAHTPGPHSTCNIIIPQAAEGTAVI